MRTLVKNAKETLQTLQGGPNRWRSAVIFGKGVTREMVVADEPPLKGAPTSTALKYFRGSFLARFILRVRASLVVFQIH